MYGHEVILDLKNADVSKFTRDALNTFLDKLCFDILEVRPIERYFWDDEGISFEEQNNPKIKGTTAIQFLLMSNITVHTLDLLRNVYINIFVCREYDELNAIDFCREFFSADIASVTVIDRL